MLTGLRGLASRVEGCLGCFDMGVTVLELRADFQCSGYKVQGFALEIVWKGTQNPIGRLFYLSTAEQVS